jgi:hypothetical protein
MVTGPSAWEGDWVQLPPCSPYFIYMLNLDVLDPMWMSISSLLKRQKLRASGSGRDGFKPQLYFSGITA